MECVNLGWLTTIGLAIYSALMTILAIIGITQLLRRFRLSLAGKSATEIRGAENKGGSAAAVIGIWALVGALVFAIILLLARTL